MGRAASLVRPLRTAVRNKATAVGETYTERMDKTGRPISPHVWPEFVPAGGVTQESKGFIYKLPAIAWSSLTMRFTGIFMTFGTSAIGVIGLAKSDAPSNIASSIGSSAIGPLAKFGVGFTCFYHYLGACRHLYWDKTAKGFSNLTMMQSSYVLVGVSSVLALGFSFYSLPAKKRDE